MKAEIGYECKCYEYGFPGEFVYTPLKDHRKIQTNFRAFITPTHNFGPWIWYRNWSKVTVLGTLRNRLST